jgi:hypothetical protein
MMRGIRCLAGRAKCPVAGRVPLSYQIWQRVSVTIALSRFADVPSATPHN